MTLRGWLFTLALVSALQACSMTIDPDKRKLGPPPVACIPSSTADCPCLDGSKSKQICNAYGRYDPCACSTGAAGKSGSTGGAGSATAGSGGAGTGR